MAVVLVDVTGARDRISWRGTQDGKFTVKTAYSLLTKQKMLLPNMQSLFDKVWRVMAPKRMRVFLCLVTNQVIMTNMERQRRHLSDTGLCPVCRAGEESIIHVLRDCPAMRGIWLRLVPTSKRDTFFAQSLIEQIYGNLREASESEGCPWPTLFVVAIWWGWKWRCGNIFGSNAKCRDRVRFVKDIAKGVTKAYLHLHGNTSVGVRVEEMIAWKPPKGEWMKLNTDGASHDNPGLATAGGVLRDGDGTWCGGFALKIEICSAPLAELWGVYYGLYIAWEKRATRLELEVDSAIVVGFLTEGISETYPCRSWYVCAMAS